MPDSASALDLTISRDRKTGHVTARGGDHFASSVLQHSAAFLPVGRRRDSHPYAPLPAHHRLPSGLTDPSEQQHQASLAAAALARIGYRPRLAPDLADPVTDEPFRQPLSWAISDLGTQFDQCEHSRDAARLLQEFTDPYDGILPSTLRVLRAAARWWQGLDDDADQRRAARIDHIAGTLTARTRRIGELAETLGERNATHPYRSPVPGPNSSVPELRTHGAPPALRAPAVWSIWELADRIDQAGHTRDVARLLADVTVPDLGLLPSAVLNLQTAAGWWQGLGTPTDHAYGDQLNHIATQLGAYARELNTLRGHLADRHLPHPHRGATEATRTPEPDRLGDRARAATSPSPGRQRATASPPPVPATPAVAAVPDAGPAQRRR